MDLLKIQYHSLKLIEGMIFHGSKPEETIHDRLRHRGYKCD